ncbi:MAG: hypothetical protein ABEJ99_02890 [Candidatus Nanohaloarchaea archaeon]
MSTGVEFSVTELSDYARYSRSGQQDKVDELVDRNLDIQGIRIYDLEPDFSGMDYDHALSILVHDAVVDLYDRNQELDEKEIFDFMASRMGERVQRSDGLNEEVLWGRVYDNKLNEVVDDIAHYYADNFVEGRDVRTEEVVGNRGFFGRADILREIDGETELRDIKTHYSDVQVTMPYQEFKMGCYALISRGDLEVERFIIEYPLQQKKLEVDPTEWFGEVVEVAEEYRGLLEDASGLDGTDLDAISIADFM